MSSKHQPLLQYLPVALFSQAESSLNYFGLFQITWYFAVPREKRESPCVSINAHQTYNLTFFLVRLVFLPFTFALPFKVPSGAQIVLYQFV